MCFIVDIRTSSHTSLDPIPLLSINEGSFLFDLASFSLLQKATPFSSIESKIECNLSNHCPLTSDDMAWQVKHQSSSFVLKKNPSYVSRLMSMMGESRLNIVILVARVHSVSIGWQRIIQSLDRATVWMCRRKRKVECLFSLKNLRRIIEFLSLGCEGHPLNHLFCCDGYDVI